MSDFEVVQCVKCNYTCIKIWYKAGCMGCWCDMLHTPLRNNAIWKVIRTRIMYTCMYITICKSNTFSLTHTSFCIPAVTVRELPCPTLGEAGIHSSLHSGMTFQMRQRYIQLLDHHTNCVYTGFCTSSTGGVPS